MGQHDGSLCSRERIASEGKSVRMTEWMAGFYANSRIADCNLVHSTGSYGENLAKGTGSFSGKAAVNLWVAEKPNYVYSSNSCVGGECLHYTQVVWRNSARLGCSRVLCNNGWWFVTCNYNPPGNYEGQRPY
ncbi:Pathogenesis-related leaf protein 6 [Morella rubra]|uniref:Pathogenesis-related leaf protein 6 n=1 Tax=Morella rubra TaxID=262757 RepID=A0A6A1V719_9ROSI|nr:Pathogenesis-related leaf protein 6 [Morella rubra]